MLKENLQQIFNEIKNGNNLGEQITLVGATKTMTVEVINEAISYGLQYVAENKVQEFREKHDKIVGATQHFIGHLQTNKVKYLIGNVEVIQSVGSLKLAECIDAESKKKGVITQILAEINIGDEATKGGLPYLEAIDTIKQMSSLSNIKILGLMAMLPNSEDETLLASLCLKMREIYDMLKQELPFKYLSVGMSHDYKIAIKNGSNMIRLGSSIFGKRN